MASTRVLDPCHADLLPSQMVQDRKHANKYDLCDNRHLLDIYHKQSKDTMAGDLYGAESCRGFICSNGTEKNDVKINGEENS